MNDESCGCPCYDCAHHDSHKCGRTSCGYAGYIRTSKPVKPIEPVASALEPVRETLRVEFRGIDDPASRARLVEWRKCTDETAGLDEDERISIRAERQLEIFGAPL